MSQALPGFVRLETGGAVLVLRADVADALVAGGAAEPESLRAAATSTYRGRGEPFGVAVPGAGRVFVRPYLHGGVFGRLTADRHAGDGRFLGELAVLVAARDAGVPVPDALGVVSRSRGLGFRRGWLLLHEITGARDVLDVLASSPPPAQRRRVLRAAGQAIRALHDAGFDHPDLHFKNLLLTQDDRVLVLDLDRVRRRAEMPRERRLAGLFRFDRYAEKQRARGAPVTRSDRLRVLRAYAGDDWPERAETRDLAERLRRHVARHAAPREAVS